MLTDHQDSYRIEISNHAISCVTICMFLHLSWYVHLMQGAINEAPHVVKKSTIGVNLSYIYIYASFLDVWKDL